MNRRTINVLYVEDDTDDRQLFADFFDDLNETARTRGEDGYYVECVANVESALDSLSLRVFDIVFIDYLLWGDGEPGDSRELLRRIREHHLKIPLVITSTFPVHAMGKGFRELLDPQHLHYLSKNDWNAGKLDETVRSLVTEPLRVLHVEDDAEDALALREALERVRKYRFDVHWVPSTEAARAACAREHFDIFLVDVLLGTEDGMQLAQEFAGQPDRPTVVLLSDLDPDRDPIRGLDPIAEPAIGYVSKDAFNRASLIRSILSQRNCPREHVIPGVYGHGPGPQ